MNPDGEHQQDHAQFRKRLDRLLILDERDRRRVRTDYDACQNVTQHHRLLQPLADDGGHGRRRHHHRQILNQLQAVHRSRFADQTRFFNQAT